MIMHVRPVSHPGFCSEFQDVQEGEIESNWDQIVDK